MTENRPTLRRYHPLWLNGPWGVVALVSTLYTLLYLAWLYFRWGGEERYCPDWRSFLHTPRSVNRCSLVLGGDTPTT